MKKIPGTKESMEIRSVLVYSRGKNFRIATFSYAFKHPNSVERVDHPKRGQAGFVRTVGLNLIPVRFVAESVGWIAEGDWNALSLRIFIV